MSAVVYGKHPAFGDFLAHGMAHGIFLKLDAWLDQTLPDVQHRLGDAWESTWRTARPMRFWIGSSVLSEPLFGLMALSQDKVGRRYPLIFALTGAAVPPPVSPEHDESIYDGLMQHVASFVMPGGGPQGAASLMQGFVPPDLSNFAWPADINSTIWGQRPDGNLSRLLNDAAHADAQKAHLTRSHWWRPAPRDGGPADWMSCSGLPDAKAFFWLLTGRAAPDADQPVDT